MQEDDMYLPAMQGIASLLVAEVLAVVAAEAAPAAVYAQVSVDATQVAVSVSTPFTHLVEPEEQ